MKQADSAIFDVSVLFWHTTRVCPTITVRRVFPYSADLIGLTQHVTFDASGASDLHCAAQAPL